MGRVQGAHYCTACITNYVNNEKEICTVWVIISVNFKDTLEKAEPLAKRSLGKTKLGIIESLG